MITGKRTMLLVLLLAVLATGQQPQPKAAWWSLTPVALPVIPAGYRNPIDALVSRVHADRGLRPAGKAGKATLLRRVCLDLTGLPPAPAEVDAFLADSSPDAYDKVVDRLLNDPQHGVRYARRWLDVLGYADVDNGMIAEPGIHHWRDWVISALNRDVPYDQFARAHIAGDLSSKPEDIFATGFLARAARSPADSGEEIAFGAVEKISSAFLAMTTACARCHDHMYDPISQRDYYAMKALFDPLVPDKRLLASAEEIIRHPDVLAKWKAAQDEIQARMDVITRPYASQIFEERMTFLPPEVAAAFRKAASQRTPAEQKMVLDYETVVTPDARKFRDVMTAEETARYEAIRKGLTELRRDPPTLPAFWSVRVDAERAARKSHIYVGGDRTKKGDEVQPGFPFAPQDIQFSGDRRQAFLGWLTSPANPLFTRVAVNRIWQWHFGEGIVTTPSDFGRTGELPTMPELLDALAAEFAARKYSMKALHRLIVTSDLYQRSSVTTPELRAANAPIDPANKYLWKYPVRRLDAEIIRDSVLHAAGTLDTSVGGRSFRAEDIMERRVMSAPRTGHYDTRTNRRGIYMGRGADLSMKMLPDYLSLFDAEDGHIPCARRSRSITAPQVLFMLNGSLTDQASKNLARRLQSEGGNTASERVDYGYKLLLGRPPSPSERDNALSWLRGGSDRQWEGFAWMLLNLSEFIFLP
jgi:hypothetical protein